MKQCILYILPIFCLLTSCKSSIKEEGVTVTKSIVDLTHTFSEELFIG